MSSAPSRGHMPCAHPFATNGHVALVLYADGLPVTPLCWPDRDGRCGCVGHRHDDAAMGKAPLLSGWQSCLLDEAQIRDIWRRYPLANVGLLLEPAGLRAIDCDSDDALAAAAWLGLPPTVIRWSARGAAYPYRRPEAHDVG